jgi:ABC-type nitrate/sulfonate/bicarbonate transport system permease component
MKKILTMLFIPFEGYSQTKWVKWVSLLIVPLLIWTFLPNNKFPPALEIIEAIPKLFAKNDLVGNFIISLSFCIKCMLYSLFIAFIFMLIARIPIFQSFAVFCRKFRFLPSVGLSFLFMRLTDNVSSQMSWMMIFGITTFLVDGSVGIALSVTKDDVNYAKSLRLSRWQVFRELVIYSKLPTFFSMAISNFAIAWMLLSSIENIAKSSGGIGVVLAESSKYFHLDEVYATQILILFTGISIDFILNKVNNWIFPYITLKTA